MKKVLTLLLFIGSGVSYGEELKFVTYLSSPVGTFSQLETADPAAPLVMTGDSQEVNFCNTRVNTGSINIRSAAGAVLNRLNLSNGTSLKGSVTDYRLSNSLTLNRGGSLTAKRILGTTAAYESSSMHKSKVNNTLYITNAGTVKGAKTESLTIRDKATTGTNGTGTTGVELWWDNQYTRDYTSAGVATGSKTYDSYLLKSKSASTCTAGEWKTVTNAPYSIRNSLLSSDCTNVLKTGDDPEKAIDLSLVTSSCTDYELQSVYWDTKTSAGSGTSDTCDGDVSSSYTCTGAKSSCTDIRVRGSWVTGKKIYFRCTKEERDSGRNSTSIDWNLSGITFAGGSSLGCGMSRVTNDTALQKCVAVKKEGYVCYQGWVSTPNVSCSRAEQINLQWYTSSTNDVLLISCEKEVKKVTCEQRMNYRHRIITCN